VRDNCSDLEIPKTARNLATFEKLAVSRATSSKAMLDTAEEDTLPWGSESEPEDCGWNDREEDVNMQIADGAGLRDERHVPSSNMVASMIMMRSTQRSHEAVDTTSLSAAIQRYHDHFANCCKCKKGKKLDVSSHHDCLLDSGASQHFTNDMSDFADYQPIESQKVNTAAKHALLEIKDKGTVFLNHYVQTPQGQLEKTTCLYPVFYIPGLSIRLMSVGVLLNNGFLMRGSSTKIAFYCRGSHSSVLETFPHMPGQTVFWLTAGFSLQQSLLAKSTVFTMDYDLWHKHFGHPSKQVLKEAQGHVKNFPKDLAFPKKDPICRGCAEGKMHSRSFPESQSCASRPFERIHSDLKSFPVDSYH